jgi:hypothetical protein
MVAVIIGCSVNDTTDITKVRPGGLLSSLTNLLIRRLPKEDTNSVGLLRPSCDADILEVRSGRLPSSIRDPFTTGRHNPNYPDLGV